METPLLQTKLYIPPPRSEQVPRPRLIERLNAALVLDPLSLGQKTRGDKYRGLHRKLTLVSAPAGFGKTTLLSEWVQAVGGATPPIAIAWLSLDESDNDPTRFLAYFVAALQTIRTDIGKGALSALQSPQRPPAEVVLTVLINEIAAVPDRIVLVLDDYHLVEAPSVHDALTFLLQHLPPQMHLIIATREDPPLPLARLRARGQLTELRAADLRFTSSEAAEFLNQVMGLDLSGEDVAALETRTEGWIVGLQLAAISMQGRKDVTGFIQSFTGSHHFVLDYLVEEVLEQQSENIQTFLLQTAVLDLLTGSLCDTLTGQDNGQATLETLERANLFIIPLDEERRWYRYRHLFCDLLRQRLRQEQPDWIPMLHVRASKWYEQNGFVDEAIAHALRADDFERAAHLIEEQVDALWGRGEHAKLKNWLVKLPTELVFSKPHLSIFHAWFLLSSGQLGAAERSLQAVEHSLDSRPDRATETESQKQNSVTSSDRVRLRGRVAAIRAFLASYRADVQGIIQHAHQALEYLSEQDLTWRSITAITLGDAHGFKGDMTAAYEARLEALKACKAAGDIYCILVASNKLAITLRAQGRLKRTIEMCQQQLQLAEQSGISQSVVVGWLLAIWGETLAELNDLDGAVRLAKKGFKLAERSGNLQMLGCGYMCLARILFSRGDLTGAEELTQKMENIGRESNLPPWISDQIAAWQARLWLAQGKLEAASQWMEERGLDIGGEPIPLHEIDYFSVFDYQTLARILIAQGRLDETARLLQRLLEAAEAGGRTAKMIEILNLQALSLQARGDIDQAITTLEKALTLAEPEGFIRIFVDEGPPMAQLLREAAARGIMPDYTAKLLAVFEGATKDEGRRTRPSAAPAAERPPSALVEPLSERELEVLQLIAEGLTNREIASRLSVSLNTVKVHTRNIYGKLNVHSRTQAIVRSQELGLLPRR